MFDWKVTHLVLSIILVGSASSTELKPYFAEPHSGQRVQQYEVELRMTREETAKFNIPDQCQALSSALINGAGQWGNRVERRMWLKVDDDCRYFQFLKNNSTPATKDFVSSYDFWNARISDLPQHPGCDPLQAFSNPASCPPPLPGMPDFIQQLSPPSGYNGSQPAESQCAFENGIFRGHIIPAGNRTLCVKEPHAPGFRILSVDFADVNRDGFMDAVLRMMAVGPGVSPVPLILPLTRSEPDKAFTIPYGTEFPAMEPSQ